jgi:hypothetical protein
MGGGPRDQGGAPPPPRAPPPAPPAAPPRPPPAGRGTSGSRITITRTPPTNRRGNTQGGGLGGPGGGLGGQGGGLGGIPGAIYNDDALNIQSNLSMGGGFDQGGVGGGQGQQLVRNTPGGGIMARIQAATSHRDNATIERELDWQARVEGDGYKEDAFCNQALGQQAFRAFAFMKG